LDINEQQYLRLADYLPRQRGNVSLSNLQVFRRAMRRREGNCYVLAAQLPPTVI
jgi:hypothetical protein